MKEKKFHRIYVLNVWLVKSFVHNINEETLVYILCSFDMSIYYRMFWCRRFPRCCRLWSIALFYQISYTVSCWKIINYSLSFECELALLFFLCKQFYLTYYYCPLLTVNCFQSKSFVWISIAWNFQSVIFLMQFIKRNFWWHTCLGHFLGNWFDIKVCCTSLC